MGSKGREASWACLNLVPTTKGEVCPRPRIGEDDAINGFSMSSDVNVNVDTLWVDLERRVDEYRHPQPLQLVVFSSPIANKRRRPPGKFQNKGSPFGPLRLRLFPCPNLVSHPFLFYEYNNVNSARCVKGYPTRMVSHRIISRSLYKTSQSEPGFRPYCSSHLSLTLLLALGD